MNIDTNELQVTINFCSGYGIPIIPVRGKIPQIKWKQYQGHCPTKEETQKWFFDGVQNNVGLVCGKLDRTEDAYLIVLDFDDEDLYHAYYEGTMPRTRVVKTRRGYHVYYLHSEGVKKSKIKIDKGKEITEIDIQGLGAYVCAPPSIHDSGVTYQWLNDYAIATFDSEYGLGFEDTISKKLEEICECNEWVILGNNKTEVMGIDRFWDGDKPHVDTIVDDLMQFYIFKTVIDTEEILFYDPVNGLYHYHGDKLVKRELQSGRYGDINRYWQSEVLNKIQGRTQITRDMINAKPHLIHMENGIYHFDSQELMPFNPNTISTIALPVRYDPTADCPAIKKFISEVITENDILGIEELFGYTLYRDYPIHKSIMYLGSGRNGKSTLIRLHTEFLGLKNVAHVPLQQLVNSRFALSHLEGEMANFNTDLPDKALSQTGNFKALCGGDIIDSDKKHKDRIEFKNNAKMIFSTNKIPETCDDTPAYFDRWIIINFPNTFQGKDADKNLIKKLTTETELSGLFNVVIAGLKRLLKNGDFSNSISADEMREKYTWLSDSLKAFVFKFVRSEPEGWISKEGFYNNYVGFCKKNNLPIKPKGTVSKQLAIHIKVEDVRPKGKQRGWKGIKIIENDDKKGIGKDKGGQKWGF